MIGGWLIEPSAWARYTEARRAGFKVEAGMFTPEPQALDRPRNMHIAGDVAEIRIQGILTAAPDWIARWFLGGNTVYSDIQAALAIADADPTIKRVQLVYDTPGGEINGLFETLAALEKFSKPKSARAALAASAGYALAALSGKIEASSPAATFGSIGVVASFFVQEDLIEVTSTKAPRKRPDVTTDEGQAVVREHLDAIHDIFADAIARGRGTTVAKVNSDFGEGGVFLAKEAKRRGMIDKVSGAPRTRTVSEDTESAPAATAEVVTEPTTEKKTMTLEELKAQHPELVKAITEQERKRCSAHLKMGSAHNLMTFAIQCIKDGTPWDDPEAQAEYQTAGKVQKEQADRQSESDSAQGTSAGTPITPTAKGPDMGDTLADRMLGKKE